MGINVAQANNQANKLGASASELNRIASKLNVVQATLNANWAGDEIKIINRAIDELEQDLRSQKKQLLQLQSDIKAVVAEIAEEEERERQRLQREKEERERREKERLEKEKEKEK